MLIDDVSIATLCDNMVYYSDGVKNTCQIKPYVFLTSDELEEYLRDGAKDITTNSECIADDTYKRPDNLTGKEFLGMGITKEEGITDFILCSMFITQELIVGRSALRLGHEKELPHHFLAHLQRDLTFVFHI